MGERPGVNPLGRFFISLVRGHERAGQRDMTINFSAGEEPPVDLLAITEDWLTEAAETLARTVQAIRAGNFAQAKDAQDCVKGLKQAVQMALEERNRVEKLRKTIAGAVGDGCLDLDAARVEIGSRLARLRDARGD